MRDFHSRPEGAPHLRLTIVHDDGEFLAKVSESLADEADKLDVPFQAHCVAGQIETLDPNDLHGVLGLKSGEARAIVCTTRLHRLLAAADDYAASSSSLSSAGHHSNQMAASIARLQQMASSCSCPPSIRGAACEDGDDGDPYRSPATPLGFVSPPLTTPPFQMPAALVGFLSAARAASPKIVVLAEQEAGHNGASFRKRVAEALSYYAAAYDSLDAAAAAYRRPAAERAEVERAVLGEEVRDVLLREGARRRERHDRLQQWARRMEAAGFRGVPLSYAALRRGVDALGGAAWGDARAESTRDACSCAGGRGLSTRFRHGGRTEARLVESAAVICHRPLLLIIALTRS